MRSEILEKANVPEAELREMEELKLINPAGFTDERIPCYTEEVVEVIKHIRNLKQLGYAANDIEKIIKKVGVPGQKGKTNVVKDAKKFFTVGNLAERVGVSPRTIKHWEEKGIIEPNMRSAGGFRLYSDEFVRICQLLIDLQLFGYSLEEIKLVSDYFREFIEIENDPYSISEIEARRKLNLMLNEIDSLLKKTEKFKKGIHRWEELVKKKRKEIQSIINQYDKKGKAKEKSSEAIHRKTKDKKLK